MRILVSPETVDWLLDLADRCKLKKSIPASEVLVLCDLAASLIAGIAEGTIRKGLANEIEDPNETAH